MEFLIVCIGSVITIFSILYMFVLSPIAMILYIALLILSFRDTLDWKVCVPTLILTPTIALIIAANVGLDVRPNLFSNVLMVTIMIVTTVVSSLLQNLIGHKNDAQESEEKPEGEFSCQSVSKQRLQYHLDEWREQKDVCNEAYDECTQQHPLKALRALVGAVRQKFQKDTKPGKANGANTDEKQILCVSVGRSTARRLADKQEVHGLAVGPVDDTVDNTFSINVYLGDAVESIEKGEGQEILL